MTKTSSGFGGGEVVSSLCTADRTSITVRGKDYCRDIIGGMSLSGFIFFHLTGREASEAEAKMLDALIISIAEHGLSPTALAARITYAAAPDALQGAVAAGILGAGPVLLGSADETAALLAEGVAMIEAGTSREDAARQLAKRVKAEGGKLAGFGHPLHKPDDPRTVRLLELAEQYGVTGPHTAFLADLSAAANKVWGRDLVVNVQAAIGAISTDMGLPPFLSRAIPILARAIGVLGHVAEEAERPIGINAVMTVYREARYDPPSE
ncbi:MAG: citryl-CoA lyase [Pseudomonadota bacterium]